MLPDHRLSGYTWERIMAPAKKATAKKTAARKPSSAAKKAAAQTRFSANLIGPRKLSAPRQKSMVKAMLRTA